MSLLPPDLPNIFSILEVVLRLRDACAVFERRVGGGLEFDAKNIALDNADKKLPYAFVVPVKKDDKEINRAEMYQSRVCTVAIIICIDGTEHKDNATGNNPVHVANTFGPIVHAVEDCLLRWKPVGFVKDDVCSFKGEHPLGANNAASWIMLEYAIPYRHYHVAYRGGMAESIEDFETKYPNYAAANLRKIFMHYRAEGEFPLGVHGQHFYDSIPFPVADPAPERVAQYEEEAEEGVITENVLALIEDRRLEDALTVAERGNDVPFNSFTDSDVLDPPPANP